MGCLEALQQTVEALIVVKLDFDPPPLAPPLYQHFGPPPSGEFLGSSRRETGWMVACCQGPVRGIVQEE